MGRMSCDKGYRGTESAKAGEQATSDKDDEALAPALRTEDSELAEVVAAWPDLEAPVRAAILTMARKLGRES